LLIFVIPAKAPYEEFRKIVLVSGTKQKGSTVICASSWCWGMIPKTVWVIEYRRERTFLVSRSWLPWRRQQSKRNNKVIQADKGRHTQQLPQRTSDQP